MSNGPGQKRRRRWQFSLRTLLLACAAVALLCATAKIAYERLTTVPLEEAVADFNADAKNDPVGKFEPPLSEEEVVASIEAQLPTLEASPQVKAIYDRIARRKRLPKGASLHPISGSAPSPGIYRKVWWINLEVMTGKNTGYGLRIRETNDPAVASRESGSTGP